ncbi:MAG: DUF1255 family protein, partial [Arenicella sp.]|nr:DUF1255 family protein [Arenicella sp.]
MLNINQYFDSKVASINVHAELQSTSFGLMDIGEYQFSTRRHELMSVINGRIVAKLANDETWPEFNTGESF